MSYHLFARCKLSAAHTFQLLSDPSAPLCTKSFVDTLLGCCSWMWKLRFGAGEEEKEPFLITVITQNVTSVFSKASNLTEFYCKM